MFGFIKNFARKLATKPAETDLAAAPETEFAPEPEQMEPEPMAHPVAPARPNQSRPIQSAYPASKGIQSSHPTSKGIEVSLQSILQALPLELQPRVKSMNVGDATISIPLEKILSQLSRGSVKISFGELRQTAPYAFTGGNDRDRVMVALPLSEILSRLNPALITRRRVQKQVEVPDDIASPFDPQSQSLIFSVGPSQPTPAPTPGPVARRTNTPPPAATPPAPAKSGIPMAPARTTITSAPTPQAPSGIPANNPVIPMSRPGRELHGGTSHIGGTSHTNGNGNGNGNGHGNGTGNGHGHTKPPVPSHPFPAQPQIPANRPIAMPQAAAPVAHTPAPIPAAPPQAPAPAVAEPASVTSTETLVVSLTDLAESWPEPVRKEVVQSKLVDSKVAFPCELVERALRQGRLVFSWKVLRSWINPAPVNYASANDALALEVPLKVVAPLFLARQKEKNESQQKVTIDDNIPNLFFGFPQTDGVGANSTAAQTAKPADTNYYVWDDSSDTVRVHESETRRGSATPGTNFVAKYATPNEVVSRASTLDGVAGALIALPDGLMVASRLSQDLNGDTLAAFLPQIFGKVSQCTKELRMGELNNLNFTVGNVPWKIFRVNAIYFAAFGKAGEPLPTAQLAALAGELDHKPK